MNNHQQLLLVDTDDTFLGIYADRLICHTGKGLHHRAFVVVVFNDKNEILLQKRKHVLWDGYWDVTAISHVIQLAGHDETYEQAAYRALKNEMGIPAITLDNIGGFNYYAQYNEYCENEYCAVLVGKWQGTIEANKNVVYEHRWMPLKQFCRDTQTNAGRYAPWTILTADILSNLPVALLSA